MRLWNTLEVLICIVLVSVNSEMLSVEELIGTKAYHSNGTLSGLTVTRDFPIHDCHGGQMMDAFLKTLDLAKLRSDLEKCPRVIYNRLPKCGSRAVATAMLLTGVTDSVNIITPEITRAHRSLTINKQRDLVDYVCTQPTPLFYTHHVFYTNFTRFHHSQPLYINVLRDPFERVISHYYFRGETAGFGSTDQHVYDSLSDCIRSNGIECYRWFANMVLQYFCGHERSCSMHNVSVRKRAIQTIENEYLVVGVTEDLPAFFEVMEAIYPKIFRNSREAYLRSEQQIKSRYKGKREEKPPLEDSHAAQMRKYLQLDYELYEYVRLRFYRILDAVREAKRYML